MKLLSYAPAYLVPQFVTLLGIYAITRILTPSEYGLYALAMSLMVPCQSFLFSWSDLGVKRFFERARRREELPVLSNTIYLGLAASSVILFAICGLGIVIIHPGSEFAGLIWIGAAVTVARQFSIISKTFQLTMLSRTRFTLMECSESIAGLASGLALCWWLGWGPTGILTGMLGGACLVLIWDRANIFKRLRAGRFDAGMQREIVGFAAPVSIAFFVEYIIASADRLLVELFLGTQALGVYAVSYSLAERGITAAFLALSVAGYPLIMLAKERRGDRAARAQARQNAEMLLAVSLPAWGGFTVAAGHIAAVLVGPEYSAEAAKLLPPTGIAIFLFALRVHYFYYSMHLTGRTWTMLQASVPAALLNLVLNVILLPRFGLIGAVWASVAAYAVGLLISVYLSIRYFPLPFPAWAAVKAAIATAAMCGLLASLRFPMNALGLAEMVLLGVTLYGTLVFAFDIGRIRSKISGMLRAREERVQLSG